MAKNPHALLVQNCLPNATNSPTTLVGFQMLPAYREIWNHLCKYVFYLMIFKIEMVKKKISAIQNESSGHPQKSLGVRISQQKCCFRYFRSLDLACPSTTSWKKSSKKCTFDLIGTEVTLIMIRWNSGWVHHKHIKGFTHYISCIQEDLEKKVHLHQKHSSEHLNNWLDSIYLAPLPK